MGIVRSGLHKKRPTGGKRHIHRKKRKYELGRPASVTKLVPGQRRVRGIRCRGGAMKFRAFRLDGGNFSWGSENIARKTRILDVVYNATSNELVRTKTLVKGAVVVLDAAPFRNWYLRHYGVLLSKKKEDEKEVKRSASQLKKFARRNKRQNLEKTLESQIRLGRLWGRISARPGQTGRADGYILEGKELEFYQKKAEKKKKARSS